MKKYILLSLLIFTAGCGNYYSVKIPYFLPESQNAAKTKEALSSLYILVKSEPEVEKNLIGNILSGLTKSGYYEVDSLSLAKRLSRLFLSNGAGVKFYRTDKTGKKKDSFATFFKPSGILEIKLSNPNVSATKKENTVYDKKTKKRIVKSVVWVYKASIRADIKLLSYPKKEMIDKWTNQFVYAEERADNKRSTEHWYRSVQESVFKSGIKKFGARYFGKSVVRNRPIFTKKKDKESEKAAVLSRKNKWEEAEALWLKRTGEKEDWRDYLNVAVSYELKKDYSNALKYYRKAKEKSARDKESKSIRWKEIFGDIEAMTSPIIQRAIGENKWFESKIAILPFANATVSLDGPVMIREMIYEGLKRSGYDVLSLKETDKILRKHGFNDGGQLGAAQNEDLCEWLGVQRLVFSNLTDFNQVMAGIYSKRSVQGEVSIWSLKTKRGILAAQESVVRVSLPKSLVKGLAWQLANNLWEKIKNKPLAHESSIFVRRVVGAFPSKPAE